MSTTFKYKGHEGSVEVSIDDKVLYGRLLYIGDLVTYQAETVDALREAFQEAVDDYIHTCAQLGKEPERPYKGSFNVRVDPDLHRRSAKEAARRGLTLNALTGLALAREVDGPPTLVDVSPGMRPQLIEMHLFRQALTVAATSRAEVRQVSDYAH